MYGHVERTDWLTPGLVRVLLGGPGLDGFAMPEATDAYLNLAIPPTGAPYAAEFDPAQVKAEFAKELWPARRRYTVRSWDPESRLLAIDFVVHGDAGIAGPWAANASQGDVLVFEGPSGGYRPDDSADWHLMVGDESALPAIAAALEVLAPAARAVVRLLCDSPEHELELRSHGDLDLAWLHRGQSAIGPESLVDAVRNVDFPQGRAHAFLHGEAEEIRALRRHLLGERGIDRADMSCSPYWRRTMTDESWRQVKGDFVAAMETDVT